MIVADTNLLVYLLIRSEQTEIAAQVFHKDSTWAVPYLWRSEMRNVLASMMRKSILTLDQCLITMRHAENLVRDHEYTLSSQVILDLAHRTKCTAYDCEFAALAIDLGVPLITSDKLLLDQFPGIAIKGEDFLYV